MLLTITEAATKLITTPGAARGVLDRLKVKPFNLGRGRGLGLRWKSEEIDAALELSREPPSQCGGQGFDPPHLHQQLKGVR